MMQQGFRGGLPPMGGLPGGLQGGYGGAAPTANLFSSIPGLDTNMLGAAAPTNTVGPTSGGEPDSGDSSGGGGGTGKGKKSAEQRAAAVQEKNRRAQKRFRERQVRRDARWQQLPWQTARVQLPPSSRWILPCQAAHTRRVKLPAAP